MSRNIKKGPPNLATDPINKLIWRFAVPGIISQTITAVYNLVDQIFIGRGVADIAIGATNICMPLTSVVTAFGALLGMGGAACFSLAMGRKQEKRAGDVAGNAIILLCLIGIILGAMTSIGLYPMLRAFGANDEIMIYAVPYARIICLGLPFGIFATGMSYFVRADGDPNYSMMILLSGAVFNLFADPLFLYVFKLGISGIALATVLGQVLSAGIALYYLIKRFRTIPWKKEFFLLRGQLAKDITISGSAIFATHVCAIIVQIIQNNSFKAYGEMSIYGSSIPFAAIGAVSKVNIMLMSAVIGIALSSQPIIGFNYGHKSYGRVKKTYLTVLRYNTMVSIFAFFCLQLFPRQIMSIFGSGNELFYEFGTLYIRIFLMLLFAGGVLPTSSTFFTAIGKAKIGMRLTLLKQVILLIPLTLILPRFMGIKGVLAASPMADGIILLVLIILVGKELKDIDQLEKEKDSKIANE